MPGPGSEVERPCRREMSSQTRHGRAIDDGAYLPPSLPPKFVGRLVQALAVGVHVTVRISYGPAARRFMMR